LRSPAWDGAPHRLNSYELAALARGKLTARIAAKLVVAESSKHRLLVEAVRRRVAAVAPAGDRQIFDAAIRVLTEVEAHSPAVITRFLSLPQIGSWAVSFLRRTANGWDGREAGESQVPLGADLGYLAAVAAAAAMQCAHPVELHVPLRAGALLLPSLGMAYLGPGNPWRTVQLRVAGDVATAISENRTVILPTSGDPNSSTGVRWQSIPRLRTEANGVTLEVALDALDPFLSTLGEPAVPSAAELSTWQQRLAKAWQILVQYRRETAEVFAAAVSTLAPLADTSIADSRSATSGWTFGAIGLSLPRTPVSLAETFVHELQHTILGAVEDLEPLAVGQVDEPLGYAPWRDDPRPLAGILHGCYAYLGLTAFWRQQRHIGEQPDRIRSEVEFARWRLATLDAASKVSGSPNLTQAGRLVVTGISNELSHWRGDPVTPEAERLADEARTEHRSRWRINYMRPPDSTVREFANAWLSGAQKLQYRADMDSIRRTRDPVIGPVLGYFMEARYRDPLRVELLMQGGGTGTPLGELTERLNEADIALLHHDNNTAVREYARRLLVSSDVSAWVGLAIALQGSGSPVSAWLLTERPELVAAVYSHIYAICGESPEPMELAEWLGRCLMPLKTLSEAPLR
jgi:HEXXH motif-containing protein